MGRRSMILKKTNAVLSLFTLLGMVIHIGYNVFAYLTFYYNPGLKMMTAYPFMICVCLHAVLGVFLVIAGGDGTGIRYYPGLNLTTVIQRTSAALILLLLVVHIRMFDLMKYASSQGNWPLWWLLVFSEVLFFAAVISHVSVSFSKALVTLGWLGSMETKRKIDRTVYVLGALIFLFTLYAVIKGQIMMFTA